MSTWRERARTEMKAKRVTQERLAETLGVTQGAVQHWLAGTRKPDLETLQSIADALGTSQGWLLLGIDDQSQVHDLPAWAAGPLKALIRDTRSGLLDEGWYARLQLALNLISPGAAETRDFAGDPATARATTI